MKIQTNKQTNKQYDNTLNTQVTQLLFIVWSFHAFILTTSRVYRLLGGSSPGKIGPTVLRGRQFVGNGKLVYVQLMKFMFMPPQTVLNGCYLCYTQCPVLPCPVSTWTRPHGGRVHYTHPRVEASYDRERSIAV